MINWVIQEKPFKEDLASLKSEIVKRGHSLYLVEYSSHEKQDVPVLGEATVFYGSLEMAQKLLRQVNWIGLFCDLPKLKCSTYYPELGEFLLNSPYMFFPLGDFNNLRSFIFRNLGNNSDVFLRPDSGFKLFTGGLINQFESLNHFLCGSHFFKNDLALAAKPAKIWREWRLVVCNEKVVAASQYQKYGLLETEIGCPPKVIEFGNRIAQKWQPAPAFTIDIAETKDGFFLLELNSFSCSGLYECEASEIVREVSQLVLNLQNDY